MIYHKVTQDRSSTDKDNQSHKGEEDFLFHTIDTSNKKRYVIKCSIVILLGFNTFIAFVIHIIRFMKKILQFLPYSYHIHV